MSALTVVEDAEPDEVFSVLSDDTRIAILQTLWESEDLPLSFSALRHAVGVRDSGQFNYHLKELCGRFVRKTEDGYVLSQAGQQINGAIDAGSYTVDGAIDPITLDSGCQGCGESRRLRYEDETVIIECEGCDVGYRFGVPPAAFADHDTHTIPAVAGRYLRTTIDHLNNGFCPFCEHGVEPRIRAVTDIEPVRDHETEDIPDGFADDLDSVPLFQFDCQHCTASPTIGLHLALLEHPVVTEFYYEHGVNVREEPIWAFTDLDPRRETIETQDPFRASVTYTEAGDTLTVVVDETGTVQSVERSG